MSPAARTALPEDVPAIRALERRAGVPFRALGLTAVAEDDPPGVAELTEAARGSRILVIDSTTDPGVLVAWLWWGHADGDLLIEQVSVDPVCRGQRLGASLISRAVEIARGRGLPGVSLTSFVDVPWNGPYYRRLGFVELQESELGPELQRIRSAEKDAGLDLRPRAAYRLPVPSADTGEG